MLRGIWTEDNFNFKGNFYRINDFTLKPKPVQSPHPEIFQGGNSKAARQMAGRVADWYFMNGNSLEGVKTQIDEIRRDCRGRRWTAGTLRRSTRSSSPARPTPKPSRSYAISSSTPTSKRFMASARRSRGRPIGARARGHVGELQFRGPRPIQ